MTAARKYYAMIPAAFSHDGAPYWLELLEVKTLTSAQSYVDSNLGGLVDAEIAVAVDGENKQVVARKNKDGKWEVVCDDEPETNPYANDQVKYYRHGPVSKEEFFAGFQRTVS